MKNQGFTIVELLSVIAIVAIITAIVGTSGLMFINSQRLNVAIDQVHRAMQEAKSNAVRDSLTWQVSFREGVDGDGTQVTQWAIHKATISPHQADWQNLHPTVRIVDWDLLDSTNETTFYRYTTGINAGTWRIQFNYKGNTNGQLGRIAIGLRSEGYDNSNRKLRCVLASTLIGVMRTSTQQPVPSSDGKYCY